MKPWTTDGCSDFGFDTGIIACADPELAADFLIACYWHDFGYWKGGTLETRRQVDRRFKSDLQSALARYEIRQRLEPDPYDVEEAFKVLDDIYHAAVRVGGWPWLPTPWRWGHGHPWLFWWAPVDEALEAEAYGRLAKLVEEARKAGK